MPLLKKRRQPSKMVSRVELESALKQKDKLEIALHVVMHECPTRAKATADGWSFTFALYRPLGAMGGIVVITGKARNGNGTMTEVHYLDDLYQATLVTHSSMVPEFRQPVTDLYNHRYNLIEAEREQKKARR